MNIIWFLRAKRWVESPPSLRRVVFIIAIIAVCLMLYTIEQIVGWPETWSPNNFQRLRIGL